MLNKEFKVNIEQNDSYMYRQINYQPIFEEKKHAQNIISCIMIREKLQQTISAKHGINYCNDMLINFELWHQ